MKKYICRIQHIKELVPERRGLLAVGAVSARKISPSKALSRAESRKTPLSAKLKFLRFYRLIPRQ